VAGRARSGRRCPALSRRLDLATARDHVDDARRRLDVAENALGADVALRVTGSVDTASRRPFGLRSSTPRGSVGLDVDLPIERTAERNAYRAAEIDVERARREVEGLEDDVTAAVRSALRALAQARRSYDIQKEACGSPSGASRARSSTSRPARPRSATCSTPRTRWSRPATR
jgi:outer membrane protein TolC